MTQAENFDPSRLTFGKKPKFIPFRVKKTTPYQQAFEDGILDPEEQVMVMPHPVRTIILTKTQMGYHHVAQGDINGEAWMITL